MEGLCGLTSDEKIKICVKEKSNRCFLIKLELNLFISNQKANFIPHSVSFSVLCISDLEWLPEKISQCYNRYGNMRYLWHFLWITSISSLLLALLFGINAKPKRLVLVWSEKQPWVLSERLGVFSSDVRSIEEEWEPLFNRMHSLSRRALKHFPGSTTFLFWRKGFLWWGVNFALAKDFKWMTRRNSCK